MNYLDQQHTAYTATYTACPHHTGWFFSVKFLFFEKRLFWCDLCHNAISAALAKALQEEYRNREAKENEPERRP